MAVSKRLRYEVRYFCGICWRILQERQGIAAALLTKEEGDAGE